MRDPEKFDEFYKDARVRLLAQTFALTGDLAASRRAVRDAFVVGWHHWRRLSQHDDPESVVRPQAWRLAQRRHTARVWHRDASISADLKATLDGLGKLSSAQRRALILTQLAAVSMQQMAREVGVPLEVAERELQLGATQLSLQLDVQTPLLRARFDDISAAAAGAVGWPRASIVRRAGATRRRTHTVVGVSAAVAALVVTGSLVTNASGVRPRLERTDGAPTGQAQATSPGADPDSTNGVTEPMPPALSATTLLGATDLGARYDRDWSIRSTGTNDDGTGLVLPCQLERYADPRGDAALVRTFKAARARQQGDLTATQLTEASTSLRRAERSYRTTASWFGDCLQDKMQLVSTGTPRGVGDEAVQVVLQAWGKSQQTYVVGVARTGRYTTTTVVTSGLDDAPDAATRRASARLLSGAVTKLCKLPDAGGCGAADIQVTPRPPLEAGPAPAMLSEIDLPPVRGVTKAWVGTEPRSPITNDAASSCDSTSFRGEFEDAPFSNNATRTFVIPGADLPTEFGITQTVGSLPGARAQALVEQVRDRLGGCDSINTNVTELTSTDARDTSLTAWRIEVEVTDARTITFLMAIIRDGTSVSQLGSFPSSPDDLGPDGFVTLSRRALERLGELPGPRKS